MASAVGTKTSFPYAATCAPLQQDAGKFKDEIVPLKIEVAVPMVLKLASLALYLACPASDFVTGAVFVVDGGQRVIPPMV